MAYYNLNSIKAKLAIDQSNTTQDNKLKDLGADSDDYINSQLGIFTTVPIADPDEQIIRLANKLTAAWYIYWNSPTHPMQGVYDVKKEIEIYVQSQYGKRTETLTQNTWGKAGSGLTGTEG